MISHASLYFIAARCCLARTFFLKALHPTREGRRGEERRGEYFAFNYACLICLYPSTSGGYSSTHPSPCGTNPKLIQSLGNFQNFSANYFIYFREYELYDRMMNEIEIKEGGKNSINPIFEDWREFRELFYIFSRIRIIRSCIVLNEIEIKRGGKGRKISSDTRASY